MTASMEHLLLLGLLVFTELHHFGALSRCAHDVQVKFVSSFTVLLLSVGLSEITACIWRDSGYFTINHFIPNYLSVS